MKILMTKNIDPIEEIERHPKYKKYADEANARIRLSIEIYEARIAKGLSQQKLAKMANTTQKVISKIESGEVNTGIDLLQRLARCLDVPFKYGSANLIGRNQVQNGQSVYKMSDILDPRYAVAQLISKESQDNYIKE